MQFAQHLAPHFRRRWARDFGSCAARGTWGASDVIRRRVTRAAGETGRLGAPLSPSGAGASAFWDLNRREGKNRPVVGGLTDPWLAISMVRRSWVVNWGRRCSISMSPVRNMHAVADATGGLRPYQISTTHEFAIEYGNLFFRISSAAARFHDYHRGVLNVQRIWHRRFANHPILTRLESGCSAQPQSSSDSARRVAFDLRVVEQRAEGEFQVSA